MTNNIHVVATGSRTPLGFDTISSVAAVQARISAFDDHPFLVDCTGNSVTGALDARLNPEITGSERLRQLIEPSLREVFAPIKATHQMRLPLFLGLPELRPGFTEEEAAAIQSEPPNFSEVSAELSDVQLFPLGHAAGFVALAHAADQINRGTYEACLVGGVDSYFHPDTIEWLDANRQISGPSSRSGFVPGEGSGLCLIMTDDARQRLGLPSMARVREVAVGTETKRMKTNDVCLGEGLSRTVHDVVSYLSPPKETINEIVCDVNGEPYRGVEWGFVCLRMSHYFDNPTDYVAPADCWGDLGAASGALFMMLACHAPRHGNSKGPRTLAWASSEGGLRGAAVLETNNQ